MLYLKHLVYLNTQFFMDFTNNIEVFGPYLLLIGSIFTLNYLTFKSATNSALGVNSFSSNRFFSKKKSFFKLY